VSFITVIIINCYKFINGIEADKRERDSERKRERERVTGRNAPEELSYAQIVNELQQLFCLRI